MANIVITSNTTSIFLNFGDVVLREKFNVKEKEMHKSEVHIDIGLNDEVIIEYEGVEYPVSFDGANDIAQVDLVDGITPTSNADLRTKLITLKNS